jgi:hypothetical protein
MQKVREQVVGGLLVAWWAVFVWVSIVAIVTRPGL